MHQRHSNLTWYGKLAGYSCKQPIHSTASEQQFPIFLIPDYWPYWDSWSISPRICYPRFSQCKCITTRHIKSLKFVVSPSTDLFDIEDTWLFSFIFYPSVTTLKLHLMLFLIQLTGRRYRLVVTIVCGCAFTLFGYDQALYGGVASGDAFLKQFEHPNASLTGQIAALYDIGCLVGSLLSVIICQRLGHRKIIVSLAADTQLFNINGY